jgi:hypothetical protein
LGQQGFGASGLRGFGSSRLKCFDLSVINVFQKKIPVESHILASTGTGFQEKPKPRILPVWM